MLQLAGKDATAPALAAHAGSKKQPEIMKRYLIGAVAAPNQIVKPKPLDAEEVYTQSNP